MRHNDKYVKAAGIDYRSHCERCSARTMTDKKQAFVKYRDELPMKFIERWLSRPVKVRVNVPMKRITSTSARRNQFLTLKFGVTRTDVDQRK